MCWCELDFWADREVVSMPRQARSFYRTLLQAAYWTSTRPYLPNDDAQLWNLADAGSIEDWQAHRQTVLAKFQPVTRGGKSLLGHKRLLRDWKRIVAWHEQQKAAGKKSAESRRGKSTRIERASNGGSTSAQQTETETETEIETETKRQNKTETETKLGTQSAKESGKRESNAEELTVSGSVSSSSLPLSVSSGSGSGSASAPDQLSESVARLGQLWGDLVLTPAERRHLSLLLRDGHSEGVIAETLNWAVRTSNHWRDKINCSGDFERAFPTIRSQYEKYMAKAKSSRMDASWAPAVGQAGDSAVRGEDCTEELEELDD
jgi:uncharacterized protein YdaU (DUF1376 family)